MKATGITRRVDELGRIVLPVELRKTLEICTKDALEFYVDGDRIILQKYRKGCIFCGETEDLTSYEGRYFCAECREKISEGKFSKTEISEVC